MENETNATEQKKEGELYSKPNILLDSSSGSTQPDRA